jgi:ADP-ribosylation factor-like protein 8
MGAIWAKISEQIIALFHEKELELCVVGLENAGKTTLLNLLSTGQPAPHDTPMPTIGLNVVTFARAGGVKMKCWDVGGQEQYRSEWTRYAKGSDVLVFVVDVADRAQLPQAKHELHRLLEDPDLAKTPLLVCANKIDIEPHASESELISALNLDYITEQPWVVFPISALRGTNIDKVMAWLIKQ